MIRLTKVARPTILEKNAAKWTKDLLQAIARGEDDLSYRASKYNHIEIKEALKTETYRKCAYCESKHLHVTYGDIEHVIPKSVEPERAFDWNNLTLACDICNTKKGAASGLVDPYSDTPSEEFEFEGPMIFYKPGKVKAELTRTRLDLNRIDLLQRRADRLEALNEKINRIQQISNPDERQALLEAAIEFEVSDEREYAACVQAFLS